jgi:hypothetical protein
MLPELVELIISYVNFEDFISDVITADPPIYVYCSLTVPPKRSLPYISIGDIEFPESLKENGISKEYCINMMPFILGDDNTLPEECKRYIPYINKCLKDCRLDYKKVCYLTIDEKYVKAGDYHRRGGLHVDTIGMHKKNGYGTYYFSKANWGGGSYGGIFIASNIDDSTMIYDYYISDDRIIGLLGSVEHLRSTLELGIKSREKHINDTYRVYLNKDGTFDQRERFDSGGVWGVLHRNHNNRTLKKNEIVWLTDRTPHESLPVKKDCFRQFFRLVTSDVTLWYSKHSTPSPFGILPGAKVVDFDKFTS